MTWMAQMKISLLLEAWNYQRFDAALINWDIANRTKGDLLR